jgi:hypothetical protein
VNDLLFADLSTRTRHNANFKLIFFLVRSNTQVVVDSGENEEYNFCENEINEA